MNKEELKKYLVRKGAETEDRVNNMTDYQLFNRFLTWHGLIEWADTIIEVYKAAFESEKKKQSVSDDLEVEINNVWDKTSDNFSEDGWKEFEDIARHFADWQREQLMKDAINITTDTEWDDIIKMLLSKLTGNEKIIIIKNE